MKTIESKIALILCIFFGLGFFTWADPTSGWSQRIGKATPTPEATPEGDEARPETTPKAEDAENEAKPDLTPVSKTAEEKGDQFMPARPSRGVEVDASAGSGAKTPQADKTPTAESQRARLQLGERGSGVLQWQRFLATKGFFRGTPEGSFGEFTRNATIEFQKANGLVADGIVTEASLRVAREQGYSILISGKADISTKADASCCRGVTRDSAEESFPDTNTRLFEGDEVGFWADEQIRTAINEIYARHGLTFKSATVQREFCKREWYRPDVTTTPARIESRLSAVERGNLKALAAERKRRQAGGHRISGLSE